MALDNKTLKIKYLIEEIIKEHNKIWEDISTNLRFWHEPKGYNKMNLKEEDIIIIASGLIRKGVRNVKNSI
jgi:hypothetical protein